MQNLFSCLPVILSISISFVLGGEVENAFLGNTFLCDWEYYAGFDDIEDERIAPGVGFVYFSNYGGASHAQIFYSGYHQDDDVRREYVVTFPGKLVSDIHGFVDGPDSIFVNWDASDFYVGHCKLQNEGHHVFKTLTENLCPEQDGP
jgi:hypothetical protein